MADGPHKSLPMSRVWKKVARQADNQACGIDEVRAALLEALYRDVRGIPAKLMQGIKDVLLGDPRLSLGGELETLRQAAAGSPFGNTILDFVIYAKDCNLEGREALIQGVTDAAIDRTDRRLRQIEEHYRRESNAGRASRLASRTAAAAEGIEVFAQTLMRSALFSVGKTPSLSSKKNGLDDGVMVGE
jgi:hypothetical protein